MKITGHFLRDTIKKLLWLHTYTDNHMFVIKTNFGTVYLADCSQVDAEIVSAHFFCISDSSAELLIAKDQNGNYAILTIFMDSPGFGGVYASITSGFTFKSIHGFGVDGDIYIIGKDLDDKWGIIRISDNNSPWGVKGGFTPNIIVHFSYESMQEALKWCHIAQEAVNNKSFKDLTLPTDLIDNFIRNDELDWGTTLQEIRQRQHRRRQDNRRQHHRSYKRKRHSSQNHK